MTSNNTGLYVHIPFCKSKCKYCDFISWAETNEKTIEEYFTCLENEILLHSALFKRQNRKISTVFIGGGTPTSVEVRYITDILHLINDNYDLVDGAEITIEANPGTVDFNSLKVYKAAGINRISFGLQAWQNNVLQFLGRIHTKEQFLKSFEEARMVGFDNINIDIIFGIPEQTMIDFEDCLTGIVALKPEHISAYSLIIEEGTELAKMIENKDVLPIDEDLDREMNFYLISFLKGNGYEHYEISNFCKNGMESKHNLIYWNCTDYLGMGLAAHSFIDGVRFSNPDSLSEYIERVRNCNLDANAIHVKHQIISKFEQMQEYMMLGFRKMTGPDSDEFYRKFGCRYVDIFYSQLKSLLSNGLIENNCGYKLTDKGMDLGNLVFMEFCGE